METQHEPEKPVRSKILSDASDHISLDEVRSSPLKRNKQNKAFTVSSSSSSCPSSHKSLKPSLCEAPRSAGPEPPGPGSRTFSGAAHMETHLTLHRWRSSAARPEQCGADAWSRSTLRARSLEPAEADAWSEARWGSAGRVSHSTAASAAQDATHVPLHVERAGLGSAGGGSLSPCTHHMHILRSSNSALCLM